MTKRIFRAIISVAVAVLLAAMGIIMGALYSYFSRVQRDQLRTEVMLAAQAVSDSGLDYLRDLEDLDCRITWISSDGQVLFDSDRASEQMENHLQREEIQQALAAGYGESARYSDTLMEQSLYAARRLEGGTVLRVSMARHTVINLMLGMLQAVCFVLAAALAVSFWLANRLSRRIVQPLNEWNPDSPDTGAEYEEVKPFLQRISFQQRQLTGQAAELKRKQREFDTVINNMNEGLVLLNDRCNVLTMNPAAARIMGLVRPYVGINFLTLERAEELENAVHTALEGRHAEYTIHLPMGDYQIDASPVRSGGKVSGLVLLMFDITQKQKLELQRREFTANVSHELKSPLHAISGYAELLKSGLVPPKDVADFSEKIYTEAQRMARLIEDILKLSRLDEEDGGMNRETVDLYAMASDVVRELAPAAEKRQVSLNLSGSSCMAEGIPNLLDAIMTNLTTNAIKYNHPGGSVNIDVRLQEEGPMLTVSDTGIGIPPEHQERIFERFYRVDKSHSKAVGGTGLGLSIVKHAALIHNAKISLHSVEGSGTTVEVRFPKTIS